MLLDYLSGFRHILKTLHDNLWIHGPFHPQQETYFVLHWSLKGHLVGPDYHDPSFPKRNGRPWPNIWAKEETGIGPKQWQKQSQPLSISSARYWSQKCSWCGVKSLWITASAEVKQCNDLWRTKSMFCASFGWYFLSEQWWVWQMTFYMITIM